MKILGGRYKGQKLMAPKSFKTRPTAAKTREALFDILQHASWGCPLENARVLDIFAGSGALGLEALSRKARFSLFIDKSPEAVRALRQNIHTMDLFESTRIYRRDARLLGMKPKGMNAFSLVFMDPPYHQGLSVSLLTRLRKNHWLTAKALCVVETAQEENLAEEPLVLKKEQKTGQSFEPTIDSDCIEGFHLFDTRRYGAARIWFLQRRLP